MFNIIPMTEKYIDDVAHIEESCFHVPWTKNDFEKEIKENKISIDFHVIVSYGVSISAVSDNLIESVKYRVEEFTGMEVEKINIFVEGVRVID